MLCEGGREGGREGEREEGEVQQSIQTRAESAFPFFIRLPNTHTWTFSCLPTRKCHPPLPPSLSLSLCSPSLSPSPPPSPLPFLLLTPTGTACLCRYPACLSAWGRVGPTARSGVPGRILGKKRGTGVLSALAACLRCFPSVFDPSLVPMEGSNVISTASAWPVVPVQTSW